MYQPSINLDIFKWGVMLEILNGIDWSLWKLKDLKLWDFPKVSFRKGKKKIRKFNSMIKGNYCRQRKPFIFLQSTD